MQIIKSYLLSCLVTVLVSGTVAAQHMSCCKAGPGEVFAKFADDPAFMMEHDIPAPFVHISESGKMIKYKTTDGKQANAFFLESAKPSDQWLIVVHEWWGLNDYVKKEAEKLYHDLGKINVIAIDLYDGQVASTREDARKYMQSVTKERAMNIIHGAFDFAGSNAKFATIGWCFGGGWSLQTFIEAGDKGLACVMYYGMPESDQERIQMIEGPVLGIFANNDKSITPEVVDQFVQNMDEAGKQLTVKRYEADHAFANPSSERYNSEAAKDAYQVAREFLIEHLK